jgi:hypothetical protein
MKLSENPLANKKQIKFWLNLKRKKQFSQKERKLNYQWIRAENGTPRVALDREKDESKESYKQVMKRPVK